MKTVLIQQVYPGHGYLPLVQRVFSRNTDYCERLGIDYQFHMAERREAVFGGWDKIDYLITAVERYELVVWLDADAILYNLDKDIRTVPLAEDCIGAVRFQIPVAHLNVGVLYARAGERTRNFLQDWISTFPGLGSWAEQAEFNRMANRDCVQVLPVEWNRNYDMVPGANPMVMGFHGFGSAERRLDLMNKVLNG